MNSLKIIGQTTSQQKKLLSSGTQGYIDPSEKVDVDEKVLCKICPEEHIPGTIYCNCGARLQTAEEHQEQKERDAQQYLKTLLMLKDLSWAFLEQNTL